MPDSLPTPALHDYRSSVEQVPAIVYIADFRRDRPFLYVSPHAETPAGLAARGLGADPDLWEKLLHPDDWERVLAEERRRLKPVQPFEAEYRLVARDGEVLWFWERDAIVFDDAGAPLFT